MTATADDHQEYARLLEDCIQKSKEANAPREYIVEMPFELKFAQEALGCSLVIYGHTLAQGTGENVEIPMLPPRPSVPTVVTTLCRQLRRVPFNGMIRQ